jgi:hypothetical protein
MGAHFLISAFATDGCVVEIGVDVVGCRALQQVDRILEPLLPP